MSDYRYLVACKTMSECSYKKIVVYKNTVRNWAVSAVYRRFTAKKTLSDNVSSI